MNWIVLGDKSGQVLLTSKKEANSGILPKGSYLTIDMSLQDPNDKRKFILRVEESEQTAIYSPSPLLADMNLGLQEADRECKNQIKAQRIFDVNEREDGLIDYIKPQSLARLSSETEIKMATDSTSNNGPSVFPSTIHASRCQKLTDLDGNLISLKIPEEVFWHQIQITGKTGSGKTVATKYIAQHFLENKIQADGIDKFGCVLAINVKDTDFLKMERATTIIDNNGDVKREWDSLGIHARGIQDFRILYSAHSSEQSLKTRGVDIDYCTPVTLNAEKIEPEAIIGIVENLTDLAAQALPDIFRYWKSYYGGGYLNFLNFFEECKANDNNFYQLDITGRESSSKLNPSTVNSMLIRLKEANKYFDNENGKEIDALELLVQGRMTVINVSDSISFGSIILRFLLNQIVELKNEREDLPPILIIIDEVHQFYQSGASKSALGDLDTICRIGRSKKIGVIFSSQNSNDIPSGLSSVVNTKLMFKSDEFNKKINGIDSDDIQSLKSGYCVSNIHGLPQLKFIKFPLSLSGVV
jgi:DNA helicase HerA-like ATPase